MQKPVARSFVDRILPPVSRPVGFRGWVVTFAAAMFAITIPLFLILGNVEYVTKSDWLYSYNWWRNGIPERTNLPVSQLDRGSEQIKDYFTNDAELLDLRVNFKGQEISLYKEREVLHMVDVKGLMQGVFTLVRVLGLVALVIAFAGLVYLKKNFWDFLMLTLRWSALGSGVIVGAFAVAILIDFNYVFRQFHFLSFANDLWLLDPYRDYLIIMFPQRFFFEATVFIAILSVAQFALLMFAADLARKRIARDAADQAG
jgi:integral membrane protein (TIGR01906 family)